MNRLVQPRNPSSPSPFFLIGEAPGRDEDKRGLAFVGRSGRLLDHYLYLAGIPEPYITNLVKRWTGPGDPDPTKAEIERDWPSLLAELEEQRPSVICTLGAVSTRFFLGDVDMDVVHGVPHRSGRWPEALIIPCYHPAAGLRDPYAASYCQMDLQEARHALLNPEAFRLVTQKACQARQDASGRPLQVKGRSSIAFDTEGFPGAIWGVSWSMDPDSGIVSKCPHTPRTVSFGPHVSIVIHHALYDLPILEELGIVIPEDQLDDTIVMAYVLQLEPQSLKALSARHLGLPMVEFRDLVRPHYEAFARTFLEKVAGEDWGKPKERLKQNSKTGVLKIYKAQGLQPRAKRALLDLAKGPVDLEHRWKSIDPEVRRPAESRLGPFPSPVDISLVPDSEAIPYSAQDAASTRALAPILLQKLKAQGLYDVYRMDMAILPMVSEMMQTGMPIDREHFARLGPILDSQMDSLTEKVSSSYMQSSHINLRSSDQVADLLYKRLGMRPPRMTDSGARGKTDEKALQTLALTAPHPVLADIVNFRELTTLKSNFVTKLPKHIGSDGRIHTTIRMTRVVSGRLSMADPPMQAIPAHSELGKEVRNGFSAPDGFLFTSHDLDQVEMRWLAIVASDPDLISLFNSGVDVHTKNAASIFGIPPERVDKGIHRLVAKRVGFGIIMGISGKGLLDQLYLAGIDRFHERECEEFIERWLDSYPKVREFMEECKREGRRQGFVKDYWGRIRYLPNIRCPIPQIEGEELRASHSHKIQAGAQGIMKRGMARVWKQIKEWREEGLDVRPVLQIHDELVCLVPEGYVDLVVPTIKALMEEDSPMFPVKIGCKGGSAKRWGELKD